MIQNKFKFNGMAYLANRKETVIMSADVHWRYLPPFKPLIIEKSTAVYRSELSMAQWGYS